jgi:hypothetical protein
MKIAVAVGATTFIGLAQTATGCVIATGYELGTSHFERIHSKSGWWSAWYVTVRNGDGPPNVTFEVACKANGSLYAITTLEDSYPKRELLYTFRFKGKPTRFTAMEAREVMLNDGWTENGQDYKQFSSYVFVGKAVEAGRPVTYVWAAWEKGYDGSEYKPVQLLKVFGTDTSHLDGLAHEDKGEGDYLIERARAGWIPRGQWPKGVKRETDLNRKWRYLAGENGHFPHFAADPWQSASPR